MAPRELRRRFLAALWHELRIVWPILSGLVALQLGLGALVAFLENWRFGQAAYFTFITGLTIGYGDFVPVRPLTRVAAVAIGFIGILLSGLIAALGVAALQQAQSERPE